MERRYERLELGSALRNRIDYSEACKELGHLLRVIYSSASKTLQGVMFRDVLIAFDSLSQMYWKQQVSAANALLQDVESVMPRQRRSLAASSFKQAVVASRRQSRHQYEQYDYSAPPDDILTLVFNFLDARSLAFCSCVCRSWRLAASDDMLWKVKYLLTFRGKLINAKTLQSCGIYVNGKTTSTDQLSKLPLRRGNWKKAFRLTCEGNPSWLFISRRAFCTTCRTFWWPSKVFYVFKGNHWLENADHQHNFTTALQNSVSKFIISEYIKSDSESSSDSDSNEGMDEGSYSKLWACPKLTEAT